MVVDLPGRLGSSQAQVTLTSVGKPELEANCLDGAFLKQTLTGKYASNRE